MQLLLVFQPKCCHLLGTVSVPRYGVESALWWAHTQLVGRDIGPRWRPGVLYRQTLVEGEAGGCASIYDDVIWLLEYIMTQHYDDCPICTWNFLIYHKIGQLNFKESFLLKWIICTPKKELTKLWHYDLNKKNLTLWYDNFVIVDIMIINIW